MPATATVQFFTGAEGCVITAQLVAENQAVGGELIPRPRLEAVTDGDGYAALALIPGSEFTVGGGLYLLTAEGPDGVEFFRVTTAIPDGDPENAVVLIGGSTCSLDFSAAGNSQYFPLFLY